ncbi:MAG: hypothetical protein WDW38_007968 [Sanguina aurantia]
MPAVLVYVASSPPLASPKPPSPSPPLPPPPKPPSPSSTPPPPTPPSPSPPLLKPTQSPPPASNTQTTCSTITSWGNSNTTYPPSPISGPFLAVAAGNGFTLALKSDGTVACWLAPYVAFGASGVNYGTCNIPAGLSGVVSIAAGWLHGMAITSNGTVVVWGSYVTVTGYGDAVMLGPAFVPALSQPIVALAGGCSHSMALTSTGQVLVWGADNSFGQTTLPPSLVGSGAQRVTAISSTANNNIALFAGGTVVVTSSPLCCRHLCQQLLASCGVSATSKLHRRSISTGAQQHGISTTCA